MGCSSSKLEDLPAVALCRDRCNYIDAALRQSNGLAETHVAFLESFKTLGLALQHFFSQDPKPQSDVHPPPVKPEPDHHLSRTSSNSEDSHLPLHSDSEDGDHTDKDSESSLLRRNHCVLNHDQTQSPVPYNFAFFNSRKPPPPPSPITPAWDLFNVFDTYDRFERFYVSSNSERESEAADEKLKFDGDDKLSGSCAKIGQEKGQSESKPSANKEEDGNGVKNENDPSKRGSDKAEDSAASTTPNGTGTLGVSECLNEIQILFEKASESGIEVLKLLNPRQRIAATKVGYVRLGIDEEVGVNMMSKRNLTSTLKMLSLWEKKLYDEVKAEEKLRTIYEKKCQQLKYLINKDAEPHRINSTRTLLRNLSTKLKIAFQVIDRISIAINNLRDGELWPQIKELNHRFLPMWKSMLECHKSQYQVVAESKGLEAMTFDSKFTNAYLEAAIQLKLELQKFTFSFSNWIDIQQDYVKSLNGWLMRCLIYEPDKDMADDGMIPFSPGRVGAPPIFVVCNQWSQSMDKVLDKEVIGAIHGFVGTIDLFLEQHNVEVQQMVIADKDLERKVKVLEREEQKIYKVMQSRESRMAVSAAEIRSTSSSLQFGLKQIFMALEKFAGNSIQQYEELGVRIEELRHEKL